MIGRSSNLAAADEKNVNVMFMVVMHLADKEWYSLLKV